MITDQKITEILATVPQEEYRDVASALTAFKQNMSASEASKYYSVSIERINEIWNKYNLSNEKTGSTKRSKKTAVIEQYLKENVGKTITPHIVVEATGISMPTFYNFYNANRSFFKKVKRGHFEIINPDMERSVQ